MCRHCIDPFNVYHCNPIQIPPFFVRLFCFLNPSLTLYTSLYLTVITTYICIIPPFLTILYLTCHCSMDNGHLVYFNASLSDHSVPQHHTFSHVMITYLHHVIQHMAFDTIYSTLVLINTFQHTMLHLALDQRLKSSIYLQTTVPKNCLTFRPEKICY